MGNHGAVKARAELGVHLRAIGTGGHLAARHVVGVADVVAGSVHQLHAVGLVGLGGIDAVLPFRHLSSHAVVHQAHGGHLANAGGAGQVLQALLVQAHHQGVVAVRALHHARGKEVAGKRNFRLSVGAHISGGVRRRARGGVGSNVAGVSGVHGGVVEQPQLAEVAGAVGPLGAHSTRRHIAHAGVKPLHVQGNLAAIGLNAGRGQLADDGVGGDGGEVGSAEIGRVVQAVAVLVHVVHVHLEAGRLDLRFGSGEVGALHVIAQRHGGGIALGGKGDGAAISGIGAGSGTLGQHFAEGGGIEVVEAAGGGVEGHLGLRHHEAQPLKGGLGHVEAAAHHGRHSGAGGGSPLHRDGDGGVAGHVLVLGASSHALR